MAGRHAHGGEAGQGAGRRRAGRRAVGRLGAEVFVHGVPDRLGSEPERTRPAEEHPECHDLVTLRHAAPRAALRGEDVPEVLRAHPLGARWWSSRASRSRRSSASASRRCSPPSRTGSEPASARRPARHVALERPPGWPPSVMRAASPAPISRPCAPRPTTRRRPVRRSRWPRSSGPPGARRRAGLGRRGRRPRPARPPPGRRPRPGARRPPPGPDRTTTAALVALLDDADVTVVEAAAWALGETVTAPPRARTPVAALAAVVTDHDDALAREAAVAALGAIGDPARPRRGARRVPRQARGPTPRGARARAVHRHRRRRRASRPRSTTATGRCVRRPRISAAEAYRRDGGVSATCGP